MSQDLCRLTLKEAIRFSKEKDCQQLLQRSLAKRIQLLNPRINAMLRVPTETGFLFPCREVADSAPLYGVPIAVKDNICIRGRETTCASKILSGNVLPYDAAVIEKLKSAGAMIHHQCNMDEFAFGSSCETSAYGPTRNPWDLERVSGGSSGGSVAAVAADMAIAALGSDTGGSIRQPAALCGVVGLKPTYGRVSRYGLIAFGSSFDQIGPVTKTVEDAAILLNILAGFDERDSTSVKHPVPDYTRALKKDVKGMRIGLPKEYFVEGIDPEVEKSVREAAGLFKRMGAELREVSLPHTEYSVAVYYIVAVAEASSNLGRFDGVRFGVRYPAEEIQDMYFKTRNQGFGPEAKRRILLGTFVLSAGYYDAYYRKGQKVRTLIRDDFSRVFGEVDLILTPTSPTPAFKVGERLQDPLAMYLSDIFTIPANLAGIPAVSIPCGFAAGDLPIGLQLMGRPFEEENILRAAHAFEQETGIYKRKPKL